jgi:ubiquinone biosynthesis monooxygenase Coq7
MAEQEAAHLKDFDAMLNARRVRPTALQPIWHLAGFALGAGAALMGERAAMACTVAVEEAIDEHYAKQADYLGEDEKELRDLIVSAREDEIDHRDTALEAGAARAPLFEPMKHAIKSGTKLAIWLSERV